MKREMVVQFHGGSEHTFPLKESQNEDELRAYFLECMSEEACKKGRVVTWSGATFVAAWIACFWFRDRPGDGEVVKIMRRQTELLEKQLNDGDEWRE